MAKFTDVSLIAQALFAQATGADEVDTIDLSETYSIGNTLSSLETLDNDIIYGALIDRIGKTVIANRLYKNKFDFLAYDEFEYGYILQNIEVDLFEARTSGKYYNGTDADADLYAIFNPTIHVTLFKNSQAWEFAVTITEKQLKSAFLSAEALAAFINGIYIAMDSSVTKSLENAARALLMAYMGELFVAQATADNASETRINAVNLAQVYYDETGEEVTISSAWYDAAFLRWCTSYFLDIKKMLGNMTVLFSPAGSNKFTEEEYLRFIINSKFANNIKRFMQSDVFNKELVNMTGVYREVDYWQAESPSIADRTTIDAKLVSGATVEGEFVNNEVKKSNVIGVMYDRYAIGMTLMERDTVAVPNPHRHRTNVFEQAAIGNFVNLRENGVVFYLDTVTKAEEPAEDAGGLS